MIGTKPAQQQALAHRPPVPQHASSTPVWLILLLLAAAIAFVVVPLWQLLFAGPFRWHVAQPAFWQGGLEALALAVLIATGFVVGRRWAVVALVVIPCALYLRRHAIDVPLLIDLIHVEVTIGTGMYVRRLLNLPAAHKAIDYLQAFVVGFAAWNVLAWTLSAIDLGSIAAMRWLLALLIIPAVIARQAPLIVFLGRKLSEESVIDRAWLGMLTAWLIVLLAKSKTAIGYDAIWYGLRAAEVFVPGDSAFESLGLVSPVHYFPKLHEMFTLPLADLRDSSVISGISVLMLIPTLIACRLAMRKLDVPAIAQLPALLAIATLPALATLATQPKPDVTATAFVMIAVLLAFDAVSRRSRSAMIWMFACLALASFSKLTAIPYAGMLLIATLLLAWRSAPVPSPPDVDVTHKMANEKFAWVALGMALLASAMTVARTWILAGVPTIGPDPLLKIWSWLGMRLVEPAGTLGWTMVQDWSDVPVLIVDWLFRPQRLPHIIVTWTGNIWLWLGIATALAAWSTRRRASREPRITMPATAWPLIALIATGLMLAVAIRYHFRGSDGNYFIYALLPAIMLGAGGLFRRLHGSRAINAVVAGMIGLVAFQGAYTFASAAWTPGTRGLDTRMDLSWKQLNVRRAITLEKAGLLAIGRYLSDAPRSTRIIGLVDRDVGLWLPRRYEDLTMISYSRPDYIDDEQILTRFIVEQNIRYMILPSPGTEIDALPASPAIEQVSNRIQAHRSTFRLDDRDYFLLDFSSVPTEVLEPLLRRPEGSESQAMISPTTDLHAPKDRARTSGRRLAHPESAKAVRLPKDRRTAFE